MLVFNKSCLLIPKKKHHHALPKSFAALLRHQHHLRTGHTATAGKAVVQGDGHLFRGLGKKNADVTKSNQIVTKIQIGQWESVQN